MNDEFVVSQSAAVLRRAADVLRRAADNLDRKSSRVESGKRIEDEMMEAANIVANCISGVQLELFVKYAAMAERVGRDEQK